MEDVEEHVVEAMGFGVYAFDCGVIIKSRIKVIDEAPNFLYLQSQLISGWAVRAENNNCHDPSLFSPQAHCKRF